MAKTKYYVVWRGKKTGIMKSWEACKESTHGFKNARYKAFATFHQAQRAFQESSTLDHSGRKGIADLTSHAGSPAPYNPNSVSVDAACSGNPGTMEYRCVDTRTGEELFYQGPFYQATNNVGEFLGLVHALAFLKKHRDTRPVYSDSGTAIAWVRNKEVRTKLKRTVQNEKVFERIEKALEWLEENRTETPIMKWETASWGEIPADFGRK